MTNTFASIEDAIAAVGRGQIVIVVDDPDRENEGDFLMAAELATPEAVNFMITEGRGLLCMPLGPQHIERLGLRAMCPNPTATTAFTVSIDAADGGSGVSAPDRATTIRRAASPDARREEFRAPGHVFPLIARPGGVLERRGHTEAAVDLARMAGLEPAGAICEICNEDGSMARLPQLIGIARRHGLHLITIEDLVRYRLEHEPVVRRTAAARLQTAYGEFTTITYASEWDDREHVALVRGDPTATTALVAVRAECIAADALGGLACSCRGELEDALRRVGGVSDGVVVYVRESAFAHGNGVHAAEEATRTEMLPDEVVASQILADLGAVAGRPVGEADASYLLRASLAGEPSTDVAPGSVAVQG